MRRHLHIGALRIRVSGQAAPTPAAARALAQQIGRELLHHVDAIAGQHHGAMRVSEVKPDPIRATAGDRSLAARVAERIAASVRGRLANGGRR